MTQVDSAIEELWSSQFLWIPKNEFIRMKRDMFFRLALVKIPSKAQPGSKEY